MRFLIVLCVLAVLSTVSNVVGILGENLLNSTLAKLFSLLAFLFFDLRRYISILTGELPNFSPASLIKGDLHGLRTK